MKKILLLVAIGVIVYTSCKKNPVEGLDQYVYAENSDNTTFKSTYPDAGFRSVIKKDTLYVRGSSGEDHLTIRLINKGAGVYRSPDLDAMLYTTVGQDVVVRTYHLNTDPANIVKITDIDQGIVKGTFDLTFKETTRGMTGTPSTLTLSNGRLRSKINNDKLDLELFFKIY
ncbi:DUF6252 family protein [Mucilaginibacter ginkgonis]|uniref:Uncharacterized protein n=1 Tax=Mucilaginibacter ginkgonis TaxID=2682091 RepID=A0A6I4I1P0_9SPHI|nr:DUF6252 family protein [Mucilaginibacter ginkgonis]QQL48744.1 hypothetical protein GO620_011195 [Mucilaginibacter ginkgonis]